MLDQLPNTIAAVGLIAAVLAMLLKRD